MGVKYFWMKPSSQYTGRDCGTEFRNPIFQIECYVPDKFTRLWRNFGSRSDRQIRIYSQLSMCSIKDHKSQESSQVFSEKKGGRCCSILSILNFCWFHPGGTSHGTFSCSCPLAWGIVIHSTSFVFRCFIAKRGQDLNQPIHSPLTWLLVCWSLDRIPTLPVGEVSSAITL